MAWYAALRLSALTQTVVIADHVRTDELAASQTAGDTTGGIRADRMAAKHPGARHTAWGKRRHRGCLSLCASASHNGSDTPPRPRCQRRPVTAPHRPRARSAFWVGPPQYRSDSYAR